MAQFGEDIIGTSAQPPFFKVANADDVGNIAPKNRIGDAAIVVPNAFIIVTSVVSCNPIWPVLP